MLVAQGDQGQGEAKPCGQGAPLLCLAWETLGWMQENSWCTEGFAGLPHPSLALVTIDTGPTVFSTGCFL